MSISREALEREVDELRQLLQAGVALVSSLLDGDDVEQLAREWIARIDARTP